MSALRIRRLVVSETLYTGVTSHVNPYTTRSNGWIFRHTPPSAVYGGGLQLSVRPACAAVALMLARWENGCTCYSSNPPEAAPSRRPQRQLSISVARKGIGQTWLRSSVTCLLEGGGDVGVTKDRYKGLKAVAVVGSSVLPCHGLTCKSATAPMMSSSVRY